LEFPLFAICDRCLLIFPYITWKKKSVREDTIGQVLDLQMITSADKQMQQLNSPLTLLCSGINKTNYLSILSYITCFNHLTISGTLHWTWWFVNRSCEQRGPRLNSVPDTASQMLTRGNHPFPWHISKPLLKKPAMWFTFIAKNAHLPRSLFFSPGHQLLFHGAAPWPVRPPAASELLPGAVLLQAKAFPNFCHCWAPGGSHHPTAPAWLGPSEEPSSRVLGSNLQTTARSIPWGAAGNKGRAVL